MVPKVKDDRAKRVTGVPHPVDIFVGSKIRQQRTLRGMSQGKLGEAVGLTFQQVQKYERGSNRVGASRLFEIARVLDRPVSFFFDGLKAEFEDGDEESGALGEEDMPFEADLIQTRETLDLVRAYYGIESAQLRKSLYEFTRSIANKNTEVQPKKT